MTTDTALVARTDTLRVRGLHPGQEQVARSAARFRVLNKGRRWGGTRLAAALAVQAAHDGGRGWWVAPTSQLAGIGWRMLRELGRDVRGTGLRLVERTLTFPSGGWVQVRTGGEPGGLRGDGLDFVIVDEAAILAEESWTAEIRPALTDRLGWAFFVSSPRGRANWFYQLYLKGQSGDPAWQSWTFPTSTNPNILPTEIEAARQAMPTDVFDQEYLAEFNDAGASPFVADDIRAMAAGWTGLAPARGDGAYLTAWDIGRRQDATVGITIDYSREPYQVVAFDRFERMPYPAQQDAIAERHAAYPNGRTIVESNGPGDPVVENLSFRAEAFQTGPRSKVNAIQALRLLLERRVLRADIPDVTNELLGYEWDDRGLRQDCVMALAIAALHLPKPDRSVPADPLPSLGVPRGGLLEPGYRDIPL